MAAHQHNKTATAQYPSILTGPHGNWNTGCGPIWTGPGGLRRPVVVSAARTLGLSASP